MVLYGLVGNLLDVNKLYFWKHVYRQAWAPPHNLLHYNIVFKVEASIVC